MAAVEARGESAFLHRASSIPVIKTTIDKVGEAYEVTKERNGLTRYTFGVAEQSAKLAAAVAAPLLWTVQKPLSVVDEVADSRLAQLEESYPDINKPTDELVSDMKTLYNSSVEPITSRVKIVKQKTEDSMQRIGNSAAAVKDASVGVSKAVHSYSTKATKAAGGYGLKKAHSVASVAADTRLGKKVLSGFDYGISTAEGVLDKFIPAGSDSQEEDSDEEAPEENRELRAMVTQAIESEIKNRTTLDNSLKNVARVTSKLRRRLGSRSSAKLEQVRTKSKESLDKLSSYLNVVEMTRNVLDGSPVQAQYESISQRLSDLWKDLSTEFEAPEEKEEYEKASLDGRAVLLGRRLFVQLRRSVAASQRLVSSLPSTPRQAGNAVLSVPAQAGSLIASVPSQTGTLLSSAATKTRQTLVEITKFADSALYQLTGVENVMDLPREFLDATRAKVGHIQESLGDVKDDLTHYRKVVTNFVLRKSVEEDSPEHSESRIPAADEDKAPAADEDEAPAADEDEAPVAGSEEAPAARPITPVVHDEE